MSPAREQGEAETPAPPARVASTPRAFPSLVILIGGPPPPGLSPPASSEPHQHHLPACRALERTISGMGLGVGGWCSTQNGSSLVLPSSKFSFWRGEDSPSWRGEAVPSLLSTCGVFLSYRAGSWLPGLTSPSETGSFLRAGTMNGSFMPALKYGSEDPAGAVSPSWQCSTGWGMEPALGQFGAGPEMWDQILTLYLHFLICQRRMEIISLSPHLCDDLKYCLSLHFSLFNEWLSSGLCSKMDRALNYESGDLSSAAPGPK